MKQFGKRCAILVLIAILLTSAFSAALAEFKPPRGIGFGNSWVKGAEKKQIHVSNGESKHENAKKQEKPEPKEDSREKVKPSKNQSKQPERLQPKHAWLEADSSKKQPKQPKQPEMKPEQPQKPWEALEPQKPSEDQPKLLDQSEQEKPVVMPPEPSQPTPQTEQPPVSQRPQPQEEEPQEEEPQEEEPPEPEQGQEAHPAEDQYEPQNSAEDQPELKPVPSGDLQDTATIELTEGRSWLRAEATKKSDDLTVIPKGTKLTYAPEENRVDEKGQVWVKVTYDGQEGWLSTKYTDKNEKALPFDEESIAASGDVNIRAGASKTSKSIGTLRKGEYAEWLGDVEIDERGVAWYRVRKDGVEGWVSSKYASLPEKKTSDPEREDIAEKVTISVLGCLDNAHPAVIVYYISGDKPLLKDIDSLVNLLPEDLSYWKIEDEDNLYTAILADITDDLLLADGAARVGKLPFILGEEITAEDWLHIMVIEELADRIGNLQKEQRVSPIVPAVGSGDMTVAWIPVVITSYEDSAAGSKFPIVRNTKIGSKLSELFRKISFKQSDDGAHGLTSVTIPSSVFDRLDDESTLPLIRRVGIQTLADQMNRVIIQMGAIEEESAKDGLEYWLLRHSAADQLLTAEPLPLVLSEEGRCAFVKSWSDGISLVDFSRFVPQRLEKEIAENGLRNPRLCEVVYDQLLTAELLPLVLPEEEIELVDRLWSNSIFFMESKPIMPLPKFGETYGNAEDRFRLIEIVNNELKENGAGSLRAYNLLSGGKKVVILNTDALRVMNGVPKSDTGYQHAFRVLFSRMEDGVPSHLAYKGYARISKEIDGANVRDTSGEIIGSVKGGGKVYIYQDDWKKLILGEFARILWEGEEAYTFTSDFAAYDPYRDYTGWSD